MLANFHIGKPNLAKTLFGGVIGLVDPILSRVVR